MTNDLPVREPIRCSQAGCTERPRWAYYWPGREDDLYACDGHARAAASIGGALGMPIVMSPLPEVTDAE